MGEHEASYILCAIPYSGAIQLEVTSLAVPESAVASSMCFLVVGVGTTGAFWSLFYVSRNVGTWNTILGAPSERQIRSYGVLVLYCIAG